MEWSGGRCVVHLEVCNPAEGGADRTSVGLPVGTMGQFLAFDTILLGSKGESTERGCKQLIEGGEVSYWE